MVESTSVLPEGRLTPQDAGIWSDEHIEGLSGIVTFAHSQSQKIGIQLGHTGRKASTHTPWMSGDPIIPQEAGGWPDDVWSVSATPYNASFPRPKELTREGIRRVVQAYADAARRAVKAGFDVVEIHSAHGYLGGSFLSPVTNNRTDEYGGSFENRIRLLLEIVDGVRVAIPESMPLFVRISATDWLEESMPDKPSWRSEDTIRLAPILYEHGVDLLDVSSGGISDKQKINTGPAYQAPFSRDVMRGLGASVSYPPNLESTLDGSSERVPRLLVTAVGSIVSASSAERLLEDGFADAIFVGRPIP